MGQHTIKVAYIFSPITFGGAEKVSLNFLRTVDRERFDIHLFLLVRPWEEASFCLHEIQDMGFRHHILPVAKSEHGDYLRILRVITTIYSLIKKERYDVLHTHGYFADICGLPVAKLLGVKGFSTCHGYISNDRKLRIYNALDKFVLRLCKKIIVVSEELRDDLIKAGIKQNKIRVIQNAVSSVFSDTFLQNCRTKSRKLLRIAEDVSVIGFVGRLSQEKGVSYLLDAASKLQGKLSEIKFIIIGDGVEREELQKQVEKRNLHDIVNFLGFQTEVDSWLPAFDLLVLPSLMEGTPMALLEAMAMGIPVIATSVGGVPKIVVDGENGLLVKPADSDAISEKIQTLVQDPELRKKLAASGLKTIQTHYDIEKWSKSIQKVYLE